MKKRIASLAVGLASDCDAPERGVEQIMRDNLANARTLPFVGFVTHDGKWVAGFSGFPRGRAFLDVLEKAEKTPLLQATKAVRKKLVGLAARAQKAEARGDWKSVLKATGDAAKTFGRCPERETLLGFEKKARDWAEAQFATALRVAKAGGDLTEARKALGAVRKSFGARPEGKEAETGLKALRKLSLVRTPEARYKAAEAYAETRWAALFEKKEDG